MEGYENAESTAAATGWRGQGLAGLGRGDARALGLGLLTSMRAQKKGHGVLSRLTPERQQEVMDYTQTHTLAETVKWLGEDGVKVTSSPLSTRLTAARLQAQLRRNEQTVEALMRDLASSQPGWTPDQIQQVGQAFFSALALEQQDIKVWQAAQALALKREQLTLEQAKFKESLRTKLETGLDAVAEAFMGNAEAMGLFQEARKLLAMA